MHVKSKRPGKVPAFVTLSVLFVLSLLPISIALLDYCRAIMRPATTTGSVKEIRIVKAGYNKHYVAHDIILTLVGSDLDFTVSTSLESCRWIAQKAPVGSRVTIAHRPPDGNFRSGIVELKNHRETIVSNRELSLAHLLIALMGVCFFVIFLFVIFRRARRKRAI